VEDHWPRRHIYLHMTPFPVPKPPCLLLPWHTIHRPHDSYILHDIPCVDAMTLILNMTPCVDAMTIYSPWHTIRRRHDLYSPWYTMRRHHYIFTMTHHAWKLIKFFYPGGKKCYFTIRKSAAAGSWLFSLSLQKAKHRPNFLRFPCLHGVVLN